MPLLASFPDLFIEAVEYLKPNMIADYPDALVDRFNKFTALNLIGVVAPKKCSSFLILSISLSIKYSLMKVNSALSLRYEQFITF